ncbi:MAG: UDP-N-acetylmuramoyl-L-alanine--D-glutamate ligase [Bacteroidetes bacterium]|nr:UDP-N-acetylmuramoyl-L-alanine--D-glutamate ligase [Bacteroidota bacterium]MBL7102802.1 UDP-N-acetylmuramoyl-L-alanine--D-glutamate ligase [Bacteroidales bacterium]
MKKKIVILGAGESGVGAAVLAMKKGFGVFISDFGKIKEKYKNVLSQFEIKYEEGKHTESLILKADEVVKSPGIPDETELVRKVKKTGIKVISEIEFAGRYTSAKKICITGSNGKTTTTLLTHHILKKAGLNAGLAGNVGQSFAMQVAEKDFEYYVLEISSFQLDGMFDFKADIAVLMNITPDHLDRYADDFQNYIDSKFRIAQNQSENDAFVYCADDPVVLKEIQKREIKSGLYPFSIKRKISGEGAFLQGNEMLINIKPNFLKMTIENLALQGKHNIYNSMAAGIASRILNIRKDIIKESLSDFQNVEHRLEFVACIHGVDFINDSKATNVNSTWYALESIHNPVIWIAGGIDKGNDYSILNDVVKEKVKALICLGKDNKKLFNAFEDVMEDIIETTSMEDAVKYASFLASKDDTVLLSPSCASFDLFENFEERGNEFKKAVSNL